MTYTGLSLTAQAKNLLWWVLSLPSILIPIIILRTMRFSQMNYKPYQGRIPFNIRLSQASLLKEKLTFYFGSPDNNISSVSASSGP